jgi:predicted acetyltransferase
MTLDLRSVGQSEAEAFTRSVYVAFGNVPHEINLARGIDRFRPDFALGVYDQGRIVAGASAFPLEMTLPAGPGQTYPLVALPGVTAVGVLPSHRRQGLLTRLMIHQLADLRQRGYAMSILLASESNIYGRFGYGLATQYQSVAVERSRAAFRPEAQGMVARGRIRMIDSDEVTKVLPLVHDRARRTRPGECRRPDRFWPWHVKDPEHERRGSGARLYAVHESAAGEADGWVSYRVRDNWVRGGLPRHEASIDDLVGTDPAVRASLWHFVLNLDLVEEVTARLQPLDEPLRWMLADGRRVRTTELSDHLWLRILDIPAALAARGYGGSERLVLDVTSPDPTVAGRFVLETGPTGATCRPARTGENAQLALGLADLGAIYLGGVASSVLAAAGRVTELHPRALAVADRLFASPVAPFCSLHF